MAWNEISLPTKARLSGTVAGELAIEVHINDQAINLLNHLCGSGSASIAPPACLEPLLHERKG